MSWRRKTDESGMTSLFLAVPFGWVARSAAEIRGCRRRHKFEGNLMSSYLDVLHWSTYGLFRAGEFRRKRPAGSWKNGVSGKL